jgi:hypothetical protein
MRSSFRILDTGGGEYFVPEIAAKLVGRAQIDLLPFEKSSKFPLHPSQIEETWRRPRSKLDQEIDIAIFPKFPCQSRTEEGQFPNAISFAKIGNLVSREFNTRFIAHFKTFLLRSFTEFTTGHRKDNGHGPGY